MNVRIAGGDRPVRAHGTPLSPMGLLPASDNAKWVGMLVSLRSGLFYRRRTSQAHRRRSAWRSWLRWVMDPAAHCALWGVHSVILPLSASHPARSLQPGAA